MSAFVTFRQARARAGSLLLVVLLSILTAGAAGAAGPIAPSGVKVTMTDPSQSYIDGYNHNNYGPLTATTQPYYVKSGTPYFYLTWTDNSSDETFFEIDVQAIDQHHNYTWQPISYAAANSTAALVPLATGGTQFLNGTTIKFRVYACYGSVSPSISVTAKSALAAAEIYFSYPLQYLDSTQIQAASTAPIGLAVSLVNGTDSTLHFSWTDRCAVEEGYELYLSTTDGGASPPTGSGPVYVFPFGGNPPDLGTGSALTPGVPYYMWIRARRSNAAYSGDYTNGFYPTAFVYSPYSNKATITLPTVLEAPTNVVATPLTENTLQLTWANHSGAVNYFQVQYHIASDTTDTDYNVWRTYYAYNANGTQINSVTVPWFPGIATQWQVVAVEYAVDASGNPLTTTDISGNTTTNPPVGQSTSASFATLTLPFKEASAVAASFAIDPTTQAPVATVTWTDNSLIATGYVVQYRQTSPTPTAFSTAQVLPSIAANSATITSDSLGGVFQSGVSYDFQVVAYYTSGSNTFQSTGSTIVTAGVPDGITSLTYAPITLGQTSFSYSMTVSAGSSLVSASITGLPGGLSFSPSTLGGTISADPSTGPSQAGLFVCPMTATFSSGVTDNKTLTLRVLRPPAAPTIPLAITDRTVGTNTASLLPLSEFFADLDTEAAVDLNITSGGTSMGDIVMVLQPTLTPATYANFMAYATSGNAAGNYAGSVFHRVSPGFVLQGGGYRPTAGDSTHTNPDNFAEVTQLPSPINEPGISNFAGTVALAKGATPSSGTHDFFISLADNRQSLDNQVGGFTAFGRVVNDTPVGAAQPYAVSQLVDAITALPFPSASYAINLTPSGSTTPVAGFNPIGGGNLGTGTFWPLVWPNSVTATPTAMDNTKCVVINSIKPVPSLVYSIVSNSDSNSVSASVDGGNNLVLLGLADGKTSQVVVQAKDVDGNVTTQTFNVNTLGAYQDAQIIGQPQSVTAIYGDTVHFTVSASGQDLQYQWRKNKVNITNQTGPQLTLSNVAAADIGDYQVTVSNGGSFNVSSVAHLTVQLPPTITVPPVAHSANYGTSTTFTVTATGDAPLTYLWYKGTPGSSTPITNATSSTLTLPSLLMSDTGLYYVVVTNNVIVNGSPGKDTSPPVQLIVNPVDSDGDGISDDVELTDGLLANKWDTDGDGYSDGVETSLMTDPRVASSTPAALWFVAQHDGAAALATIAMKRIKGTGSFPNLLYPSSQNIQQGYDNVPDQWMGSKELTNDQFASILDYALRQMNVIEVVSDNNGRRFVRYPKGSTGQTLCYLVPLPTAPGQVPVPAPMAGGLSQACDIGSDAGGTTFYVAKAVAKYPVRSVSWYGGYVATLALNTMYNYTTKCLPASWGYNPVPNGYRLPSFTSWQWAAQGTTTAYTYPTGNTISTAAANYGSASVKPSGSYAASALGLYDMAGNVAEWTSDPDPHDATLSYARGGSFATPATAAGLLDLKCNTVSDQQLPRTTISAQVGVRLALSETISPTISAQPTDQFVATGTAVTLSVTADGAPPLLYQWYKNNVAVAGKTAATLSIAAAALTDAGAYTVKVSSQGSAVVTSSAAHLSVLSVPATVYSLLAVPNKPAALPVTLASSLGTGQSFSYAWYLVPDLTDPIAATSVITGTTTAKLTFNSISTLNTGTYVCTVTPMLNGSVAVGNAAMAPLNVTSELLVMQPPSLIAGTVTLPTSVVGGGYSVNLYTGLFDTSTETKPTTFTVTGLPPGITFDPKTGMISGRATKVYDAVSIRISASNAAGSSGIATGTLNVLAMPAATIGTFVGSIGRQASLNNSLGGRVDLTSSGIGAFSGKVTMGASVYTITGNLGGSVTSDVVNSPVTTQVLIPRTGKNPLLMSLSIDTSTTTGTYLMSGSIGELPSGTTSAINVAPISGWRNVSSSLGGVVTTTSQIGRSGYHTLVLDPPAASTDATLVPQGESFVTASVASTGIVTLAGRLADGTVVAGSSVMGTVGQLLVYQPLYTGLGSTLGNLTLSNTHAFSTDATGITWLKNVSTVATDRNYKAGFGPLKLVLLSGGLYTPPVAPVVFMGLTAGQVNNAQFTFASGGLSFAVAPTSYFTQLAQVTSKNLLSFAMAPPNSQTVAGTLVPSTGVFTGTFKFGAAPMRAATYYGVVVPNPTDSTKKVGHGSFTLPSTTATTSPILSGSVLLQP